jgi:4-hydroxybenzoate polyprenyltransferase
LFIAFGALLLALSAQIQLGLKVSFQPYLSILFFATLLEYNFHKFLNLLKPKEALSSTKYDWMNQHLKLFYGLLMVSFLGLLTSLIFANSKDWWVMLPIAVLTLFYSMPILKVNHKWIRLRDIPYLKIFLIAIVWSFSTVLFPAINSNMDLFSKPVILLLIERFFFILAITLPFDIRDMASDEKLGLKTIPLLIKPKLSYQLANLFIVIFWCISLFHYTTHLWLITVPISLSAISTLVVLNHPSIQQNNYYHYGILDGMMLLQGLLVIGSYFLSVF